MPKIDIAFADLSASNLRTALTLSSATGQAFTVAGYRSTGDKRGLNRRHLATVRAAAAVCGAWIGPAGVGVTAFSFAPGPVRAGAYYFTAPLAGSAVLLLQTVLPALILADGPSVVTVDGGTHVKEGPPPEFLTRAFLPLLAKMGPRVSLVVERAGFCPAAGGRIVVTIEPARKLKPIHVLERGEARTRHCRAVVAGLSGEIALRELELVKRKLGWPSECVEISQLPDDQGPGNAVTIELGHEHVTEVFSACGARGVSAEAVAESALQQARDYLAADVPVGPNLFAPLLVSLALAGGGSFVTVPLTPEMWSDLGIVRAFVRVTIDVVLERKGHRVTIS